MLDVGRQFSLRRNPDIHLSALVVSLPFVGGVRHHSGAEGERGAPGHVEGGVGGVRVLQAAEQREYENWLDGAFKTKMINILYKGRIFSKKNDPLKYFL